MLLQITYQDKATQTDLPMEEADVKDTQTDLILQVFEQMKLLQERVITLTTEVTNVKVQVEHYKIQDKAISKDTVQEEHIKKLDLEGDDEKHLKTQITNEITVTAAGAGDVSKGKNIVTQNKPELPKKKNYNLNQIFSKPYTPNIQKSESSIPPQIHTYSESLNQQKQTYNHITRTYIDNIYTLQKLLNTKPIQSKDLAKQHQGYITQKCQNYNKLIALPDTSTNLITSCYYYGLLSIVYKTTREELTGIPDIYKGFMDYKRITKGQLFYVRFYSAPAGILFDEIK